MGLKVKPTYCVFRKNNEKRLRILINILYLIDYQYIVFNELYH